MLIHMYFFGCLVYIFQTCILMCIICLMQILSNYEIPLCNCWVNTGSGTGWRNTAHPMDRTANWWNGGCWFILTLLMHPATTLKQQSGQVFKLNWIPWIPVEAVIQIATRRDHEILFLVFPVPQLWLFHPCSYGILPWCLDFGII